jgi:hypothetical protein
MIRLRDRGGAAANGTPPRQPSPDSHPEPRQTLLLPLLFERIDEEHPLTVLDVGSGVAETIQFFAEFRCRLHFADLYDVAELAALPDDDVDEYYDGVFARLFGFPPDTSFDVCLLWDFLNHLPVPALRAFSRALAPYLHRRTVGHGFGAFKATAPALAGNAPELGFCYGIRARDQLVVRPRAGSTAASHPHSRTVLADSFKCFEIVRGTLLQEGAMELFLQATGRGD